MKPAHPTIPYTPCMADEPMTASNTRDITVTPALPHELPIIEGMMQFYNYELSAYCDIDFNLRGLYTLSPKAVYFSHTTVKPYLLRVDGAVAGFAVVDDEVVDPASQFNMGYFFIARRYKGQGLASRLAAEMFLRHPGRWEVYHYASNDPAKHFWVRAIAGAKAHDLVTSDATSDEHAVVRYLFSIAPPSDV